MSRLHITDARVLSCSGQVAGVGNARGAWQSRHGLVLWLRDAQGRVGVGEASPLPGFSRETLEECREELSWIEAAVAKGLSIGLDVEEIESVVGRPAAPAARFAVESALLDLLGQCAGWPLWQCLRALQGQVGAATGAPLAAPMPGAMPAAVLLNGVCTDSELEAALAGIEAGYARGLRCFKVKVGRDLERELAVLGAVRARFGGAVSLRVDVNQAWGPAEALEGLARLAGVTPEYVEEPVFRPEDNLAGLAPLGVPVALDESLAALPRGVTRDDDWLDGLLGRGMVSVLVLKPMLLGGFLRCLELTRRAQRHGASVVVSHLFDGPVALAGCAQLALALNSGRACGLDAHAGLAAWPALEIPYLLADRIAAPMAAGLGVTWREPWKQP